MTVDVSVLGDAVHNVLVHLAQRPLGFDEPFENRLTELEATTPQWSQIPAPMQERIRIHWRFIASLYEEARSVWLEEAGLKGSRPDMNRRMKTRYEVIEFKLSDVHSMRQKSREQVRDMMARLRGALPQGEVIKGWRITLPIDLAMPPEPVWTEITCD